MSHFQKFAAGVAKTKIANFARIQSLMNRFIHSLVTLLVRGQRFDRRLVCFSLQTPFETLSGKNLANNGHSSYKGESLAQPPC